MSSPDVAWKRFIIPPVVSYNVSDIDRQEYGSGNGKRVRGVSILARKWRVTMMDKDLQAKVDKLHFLLRSYGRVAVAFSAGVDSTVLLKAAQQVMSNEQILALTAESAFAE